MKKSEIEINDNFKPVNNFQFKIASLNIAKPCAIFNCAMMKIATPVNLVKNVLMILD